jgi:hypothetical protein
MIHNVLNTYKILSLDKSYMEWLCANDMTIKEKGINLIFCNK